MDSSKKKKVMEKFATTLLECTLKTDVKIGKTYKVEVSDDGFTVRKRRQKPEDGMHFRYDVVESYQSNHDGDQFVLNIAPSILGTAGGFFRMKTKEAAKIVSLASRLSVVAAVRKEALSRTASGGSVPSSPRSPARVNSSGSPFTPVQNGGAASASSSFAALQQSTASGSSFPSSPASVSSASTKGGSSQELSVAPQKGGSPGVTPPKWTLSPTPYAAAKTADPSSGKVAAKSGAERGTSAEKRALAEALRKELRRSEEQSTKNRALFARDSSFDSAASADGAAERAQTSVKPPSAGSSNASSPKGSEHAPGGAWATDEGFRVPGRSSEEGSRLSARLSDEGVRVSSRLSQGSSPSVSRQSSVKSVYSRQSSAGSRGEASGPGGIRLLPRVSSNPFLAAAGGEDPRPASSIPPPPTSPKKGVFEGFEQFIKVATPRASSDVSRRASSDVSRRSSEKSNSGGPLSPVDLLNGRDDEDCAPPLVVEISPRKPSALVSGGSKWQGLDAEVPPGTWALPEVGVEWLDASPISSPPARTDSGLPAGTDILGTSPTYAVTRPTHGANPSLTPSSPGANSARNPVTNPSQWSGLAEDGTGQTSSPAGNPFRAAYPDPFVAAFGSVSAPVTRPVRTKSTNPFAEPSSADAPETFAAHAQIPPHRSEPPRTDKPAEVRNSPLSNDRRELNQLAPVTSQTTKPDSKPLATQNGRFQRSVTEPTDQAYWEPFSSGVSSPPDPASPVLTRSATDPHNPKSDRSISAPDDVKVKGSGDGPVAWEPFSTDALGDARAPAIKSASVAAVVDDIVSKASPDGWEAFGRD